METGVEVKKVFFFVVHSDPTYEAWKPWYKKQSLEMITTTPILPMRHGNEELEILVDLFIFTLRSYL